MRECKRESEKRKQVEGSEKETDHKFGQMQFIYRNELFLGR